MLLRSDYLVGNLTKGAVKRPLALIDPDLAGNLDEPLDLGWIVLRAWSLRLAWHGAIIP